MNSIINVLHAKLALLDIHTLDVFRKSFTSLGVKAIGMAFGLCTSVYLGRTIGSGGLGIINLTHSIVDLLLVITMFGFYQVIVKNVSIAFANKNSKGIADILFTSNIFIGGLAFAISITGIFYTPWLAGNFFNNPDVEIPLTISLITLIPYTFSRIYAGALVGFRKVWQSNLVHNSLDSVIVGCCLLLLHMFNVNVDVIMAAIVYATGRVTVTFIALIYWRSLFKYKGKKSWNGKPMFAMAKPMLLVAASSVMTVKASFIMLAWLGNTHDVGLYGVAWRIAMLTSLILNVSNSAVSPKLAVLHAKGRITEMATMVRRTTAFFIALASMLLILFVFFGETILGLWGQEFREAYAILIILSIGQLVNISTGCSAMLLIMCGFEKLRSKISFLTVIFNLIITYVLILNYGAMGAAIATALTVIGENLVQIFFIRKNIGFWVVGIKARPPFSQINK